jgi:effector protein DrrA/SidM
MSEIKDLYADYRFLNPLVGAAKEKYDYYLSQLKTFSNPIEQDIKGDSLLPWQTWENGLRLLYKEMIFDIFKSKNIEGATYVEKL